MQKPAFLFGDSIVELDDYLFDEHKWFHKIGERYLFVPNL